jgi:hypothetical protein
MSTVVHMRDWVAARPGRSRLAELFGRVQRMRNAQWDYCHDGTLLSLAFVLCGTCHIFTVFIL